MSITLTHDQLKDLTRRERPTAQARVLRSLGIPYKVHPSDAVLLVSTAAVQSILGVTLPAEPSNDEFVVDTEKIKAHGTPAKRR